MKGGAERSGRAGMRPVRGKRTWKGPRLSREGQTWPSGRVGTGVAVSDASCDL
jgi:hypothetical protein